MSSIKQMTEQLTSARVSQQHVSAKDRVMRMVEDRGYVDSKAYADEYGLPIKIARWHVSRVARQVGLVVVRHEQNATGRDRFVWAERNPQGN